MYAVIEQGGKQYKVACGDVVNIDLPDVAEGATSIELDKVLFINDEKEVKEDNYYRRELAYGTFQRSFALPEGVDADNIKADYKDGIIKITIPKPEARQPKKITVQ